MADNFAKINKGVNYKSQGTTPSNLADGDMWYDSTSGFQIRNLGSTKSLPGSGGGGGGINFAGLSTTWALATQDDRDAETSVGNWATYADAAGSVPVDMTGGTATQITFSRTTTSGEILDGNASFKVVKAAANAQGQGISLLCNVPVAYQGKVAQINIPYKVISGSLATGDLILAAYDVTNSNLLTVTPNIVASTNSTISALVFIPSPAVTPANLQIRIGFHFASTSTTAVTLAWDDVSFGPQTSVLGTIMTDWASYTPTTQGFGTLGTTNLQWRRVGDSIELLGFFIAGTTTASEARVNFPSSLLSSSSKITAITLVGTASNSSTGSPSIFNVLAESGVGYVTFSYRDGGTAANTKQNASSMFSTGATVYINCKVPIQGWSAIPENTVVTAPQDSMVRVDTTNGWGSTNTNIRKYTTLTTNVGSDITYTSSTTLGDSWKINTPGVYVLTASDVFSANGNIGFSRNSTQLTTEISSITVTDRLAIISELSGNFYNWNSTVFCNAGDVIRVHGDGMSSSNTTGSFTITKQSVAPMTALPRSMIHVNTTNGLGSVDTKIRRWANVVSSIGTAITRASNANNGDTFTINQTGVYAISYTDLFNTAILIGISVNSTQLTTEIQNITAANRYAMVDMASSSSTTYCGWTGILNAGDVVRCHVRGSTDSVGNEVRGQFIITQVSN